MKGIEVPHACHSDLAGGGETVVRFVQAFEADDMPGKLLWAGTGTTECAVPYQFVQFVNPDIEQGAWVLSVPKMNVVAQALRTNTLWSPLVCMSAYAGLCVEPFVALRKR